jgi:Cu(I)/Ag(I) efflux system membrane fusion protein
MNRNLIIALGAIAALATASFAAYRFGMNRGMNMTAPAPAVSAASTASGNIDPETGKKVLFWHDPMVPGQKFDKPGKSPFMDMMLVPVFADEGGDDATVKVSPRMAQNLGIRTAEVTRGTLTARIQTAGVIAFDERAVATVQARVGGYVEKLLVRAPLDPVIRGQPLALLLASDWVAAQEEYLALRRDPHADAALRDAARQRLMLLGVPETTIAALEGDGKVRALVTLTAPANGVIGELGAREGMTVMPGSMLFRINGLDTVWVNAEVPETQAAGLAPGGAIEATVASYPGEVFRGRIAALLPEVNAATRTLKTRIVLDNPGARLKPGMFATVYFTPPPRRDALLVPSEALIQTGKRSVVVVAIADADGTTRFNSVDVEAGSEANGMTEIRKGLDAGMKIVVSGQFLIDSESSLKSTGLRMSDMPGGAEGAAK